MSFKDLGISQSLIDAVSSILNKSLSEQTCTVHEQGCDCTSKAKKTAAHSGLPTLGETEAKDEAEENEQLESEQEKESELASVNESCQVASKEPASAVTMRDRNLPKHIDIISDIDLTQRAADDIRPDSERTAYRALVTYATGMPEIIPAPHLPGAKRKEDLYDILSVYENYESVLLPLLIDAMGDLPHEQPQFKGNDRD
jgi:hypothetical protein